MAEEPIVIAPYDANWPIMFAAEKARLETVFPAGSVSIEHVGSTAVRGLAAKPVVDMMLGGPDLTFIYERTPRVLDLGYDFPEARNRDWPERRYYRKFVNGVRMFHLHCVVVDGELWRTHLLFRDYLRAHPRAARDYGNLKMGLASTYRDNRPAYTDGKAEFITKILVEAAMKSKSVSDTDVSP